MRNPLFSTLSSLLLIWCVSAVAAPVLVLNSSRSAPLTTPDRSGVLDHFYAELSARLGITIEIQHLPAERALLNANRSVDDGDVCRVAGLEETYPHLVRVPEAVMRFEHVIFSREADFVVTGPEDLTPYDVGVVKGWKIIEWNTRAARSVTLVESGEQLFAMLVDGRIDLAIIERLSGMMSLGALGATGIRILEPAFLSGDWHLYLHERHRDLVPVIAAEIRRMKADGSHRRIFDAARRLVAP